MQDRQSQAIDGAQEQFAQHVEGLILEVAVQGAIDILFVDDLAGLHAPLKDLRRNVERNYFIGGLQKRKRTISRTG